MECENRKRMEVGMWLGCGLCEVCCSESLSDCGQPTFVAAGEPVVVTRRVGVEYDNGYGCDEVEFQTTVHGVFSCVTKAYADAIGQASKVACLGYVLDEFYVQTFELDGALGAELLLIQK